MGMLSDFLTIVKGTQTNITGYLKGDGSKVSGADFADDVADVIDENTLITELSITASHDGEITLPRSSFYFIFATSNNASYQGFIAACYVPATGDARAAIVNNFTDETILTFSGNKLVIDQPSTGVPFEFFVLHVKGKVPTIANT